MEWNPPISWRHCEEMAKEIRVYWDACTWIAYINQEKIVEEVNQTRTDRFEMCRAILDRAEKGEIEIVTSAFTLAEVCKPPNIDTSPLDRLPSFFEKSYILIVPVDMAVGLKSQKIQDSGLVNIKPPDAIHLASAQIASVSEFHTFDNRILKFDGHLAGLDGNVIKICRPIEGKPLGPLFDNQQNQGSK